MDDSLALILSDEYAVILLEALKNENREFDIIKGRLGK